MILCVAKRWFTSVMAVRAELFLLSVTICLSGCISLRSTTAVTYTDGAIVTALSSNVSLAYTTPKRSISGSGFLMYQKPDQMRVVILSPFGSVIQEVYVSGELITIIDTGNGVALSGNSSELPDKGDFSAWRYIHWLVDIDQPVAARNSAVIERFNRFGQREKAVFENGLLISKTTATGDQVCYGRYTSVQGAAVPLEITYETATKEKLTILLEDPEINVPFTDGAFTPDLGKLHVYPLSSMKAQ